MDLVSGALIIVGAEAVLTAFIFFITNKPKKNSNGK